MCPVPPDSAYKPLNSKPYATDVPSIYEDIYLNTFFGNLFQKIKSMILTSVQDFLDFIKYGFLSRMVEYGITKKLFLKAQNT